MRCIEGPVRTCLGGTPDNHTGGIGHQPCGSICSGIRLFARFDDINFSLPGYRLDPPDKTAVTAFLDRRLGGAKAGRMHVNLDSRSFSAIGTFHANLLISGIR
jgi:hypothetical protein